VVKENAVTWAYQFGNLDTFATCLSTPSASAAVVNLPFPCLPSLELNA
jgi:hypothetical protein